MNTYLGQLRAFVVSLPPRQRLTLGAVVLGGLLLLGAVGYWASRPDYALLFGGLDAASAARVVEHVQGEGLPYDLRDNGTAVFVPREAVHELRLRLAATGAVSDGQTGYELFDGGTLGMTDFMQKVSYKRALEGELARTVISVRGVEGARVHLVLPTRSPFRDRQAEASASVVLHLDGGARPSREQVAAIAALVGGAVEGLQPGAVTVVDAQGELLSNPAGAAADGALSSSQLQVRRAVEEHLAEQGQTMLDRVLGPGRALVRVAAALDFSRTITETERIDPESQTIISEERIDEQGAAGGAASTVRNYELSREREQRERAAGEVERLTVSVILDHRPPPGAEAAGEGEEVPAPVPYTEAEIAEVTALVTNAVGLNEDRGDRITVQQARFDQTDDSVFLAERAAERADERLRLYLRYGLMALALVVAAGLLRMATSRAVAIAAPPGPAPSPQLPEPERPALPESGEGEVAALKARQAEKAKSIETVVEDFYTSRLSSDARARLNAKRRFYETTQAMVAEQPEEAAALIGTWLAEDRSRTN